MNCRDAEALTAAAVDDELHRLQAHSLRRHLASCPACAARHDASLALHQRIRAEVPRYAMPPELRARLRASAPLEAEGNVPKRARPPESRWRWLAAGAAAGCAATIVAWFVAAAFIDWRASEDLAAEAVNTHVRATLGNQLTQVASSDQHTVKPWLSARLDYSPPVRDYAQEGFTSIGGRIDYLDRHPVATLVYRYRQHTIDVFVRPQGARASPAALRSLRGFNIARGEASGMEWLAVSDVVPDVLASLVDRIVRDAAAP